MDAVGRTASNHHAGVMEYCNDSLNHQHGECCSLYSNSSHFGGPVSPRNIFKNGRSDSSGGCEQQGDCTSTHYSYTNSYQQQSEPQPDWVEQLSSFADGSINTNHYQPQSASILPERLSWMGCTTSTHHTTSRVAGICIQVSRYLC